jgi:hypothetical protein
MVNATIDEQVSEISEMYVSGIMEQDCDDLSTLNALILDDSVATVVKEEAYKKVCEANWKECYLTDLDEYRESLLEMFSEHR